MIKVEPLENIIYHNEILNHTQEKIREERKIIESYLDNLKSQIDDYCNNEKDYSELKALETTTDVHDVLYGLYDSDESIIKTMKSNIKKKYKKNYYSHNANRCPYCGILRQSSSALDHFLPRSVFPEYSILSSNLVYICEICNNKAHKGVLVNDSDGIRLFLHPYSDKLIEEHTLIDCKIEFNNLTVLPTFSICKSINDVDENLYKIACNHMMKLKLNKRYSELVENDLLCKFRRKFSNLDKKTRVRKYKDKIDVDDILRFINDRIEECDETDLNNWELIFWKEFIKKTFWFESLEGKEIEESNED
jgi:hypothetical protein